MKKLFLLLAIITVGLALTGCSQQTKTTEQGLTKSELFDKKQECTKYTDKIKEDLKIEEKNGYGIQGSLKKIFYSKKRNSCIYIINYSMIDKDKNKKLMDEDYIYDYFTKEVIISKDNICYETYKEENNDFLNSMCGSVIKSYNSLLKELKGE